MTAASAISRGGARDVESIMPVMSCAFDPLLGEAWTAAQCSGALTLPGSLFLISRTDDVVTGFALARSVLDEAELLLLAVRPGQQRLGTGSALLVRTTGILRENHVGRLHLEVRADNPARSFYLAHGFSQVGVRRDYYRGPAGARTDAVTLLCNLS